MSLLVLHNPQKKIDILQSFDAEWIAATTFMQRRKRKILRHSKACDMRKLSDFTQIYMQQTPGGKKQCMYTWL